MIARTQAQVERDGDTAKSSDGLLTLFLKLLAILCSHQTCKPYLSIITQLNHCIDCITSHHLPHDSAEMPRHFEK